MMYRWSGLKVRPLPTLFRVFAVFIFILGFRYMLSSETKQEKKEIILDEHYNEFNAKEKRLEDHKMRTKIDVNKWNENPTVGCGGHFNGFGEEFVRLTFARVNPYTKTFFLPCEGQIPEFRFQYGREGTPLQAWLNNMITYSPSLMPQLELINTTTVVIYRNEAHNLYHTMCEWFNIFLLSKLQHFDPSNIMILFMDDRPPGHMDETWTVLFKHVLKRSLGLQYAFTDLFWNIIGYESPMNHHNIHKLPHVEEFRDFFLNSFNIRDTKTLYCRRLTVTIIIRRDYMTHPERLNMTGGLVHRKFKNEDDVIDIAKRVFDKAEVYIVILEKLTMERQLEMVTKSDVFIGMHGAGMSHILFLPKHAVVFEMFPKYWGFFHHFKAMARWRHLKYFGWQNTNPDNEFPKFYTHIPANVLRHHYESIKQHLCGS